MEGKNTHVGPGEDDRSRWGSTTDQWVPARRWAGDRACDTPCRICRTGAVDHRFRRTHIHSSWRDCNHPPPRTLPSSLYPPSTCTSSSSSSPSATATPTAVSPAASLTGAAPPSHELTGTSWMAPLKRVGIGIEGIVSRVNWECGENEGWWCDGWQFFHCVFYFIFFYVCRGCKKNGGRRGPGRGI